MTKRSHEIASRQAEIARERKRKKKLQMLRPATPGESGAGAAAPSSGGADSVMGSVSAQPAQAISVEDAQYRHVKSDLKLIAIVATPIVIVLIVLAIVL
jgi:hypothetical protein